MTHVLVFHHEHAFDLEPTCEAIYGPMSLEEAKAALIRLRDSINADRNKETEGHWKLSDCGTYIGMDEEDYLRLNCPDISSELWANVQPVHTRVPW